jgi:hypothetical protein
MLSDKLKIKIKVRGPQGKGACIQGEIAQQVKGKKLDLLY